jgi:hypothetical protein
MRFVSRLPLWTLALVAVGACSSKQSAAPGDAGDNVSEGDGSTADCTSIGGTCQPSLSPGCPLLQQNPTLCGNVLLVCCLLASDASIEEGDDAAVSDAATVPPTADAAPVVDAAPRDAATD